MTRLNAIDIAAVIKGYSDEPLSSIECEIIKRCDPFAIVPVQRDDYRTIARRILYAVLHQSHGVTTRRIDLTPAARNILDTMPTNLTKQILGV